MLKRITIENYRSCLLTSINLHPNLSVLIGPNGSGKTNVLQAIMLLNKLAVESEHFGRRQKQVQISSRLGAVFETGRARAQLNATIYVRPDEANTDVMLAARQKWRLERGGRRSPRFDFPLIVAAQRGLSVNEAQYVRFVHPDMHRYYVLAQTVPSKFRKWTYPILVEVGRYCRGIKYYGASQFTNPSTCPASFEIEQEGGRRRGLFRLRGHAKVLYNMYTKKSEGGPGYERFMEIVGPKGLRLIDALSFKEVQTSSTDYSVRVGGKVEVRRRHKLLVIPQFRIGRQKLSPNQLSEGTFKTLSLIFHIITDDATALLIEEPEVCIHHGLLSSILELIRSYSHSKQMILSTHSDYVLDHVAPENVYRVGFEKPYGTIVQHVPDTMNSEEFSALREYLEREGNLGEYWREGGLGDRA